MLLFLPIILFPYICSAVVPIYYALKLTYSLIMLKNVCTLTKYHISYCTEACIAGACFSGAPDGTYM